MKKMLLNLCTSLLPLFPPFFLTAQWHDGVWAFGISAQCNEPPPNCTDTAIFGMNIMDFRLPSPAPASACWDDTIFFQSCCSWHVMGDSSGTPLYYSNGIHLMNMVHEVMPGGDSINFGPAWLNDEQYGVGYLVYQSMLSLPVAGSPGRYALFHMRQYQGPGSYLYNGVWYTTQTDVKYTEELLYTEVDMNANGGLGAVTVREQVLLADTLASGNLTACQHANGRDWWIVVPRSKAAGDNCYYVLLFGPDGVTNTGLQCLGHPFNRWQYWGQSVFSPDGEHYLRNSAGMNERAEVFSFDRCSGQLGGPLYSRAYVYPDYIDRTSGVAVSPNGRYAYLSNTDSCQQIDLWAGGQAEIEQSRTLLGTYTGPYFDSTIMCGTNPQPSLNIYFHMQLAPDGKIYDCGGVQMRSNVIHAPDSAAPSCRALPHDISWPKVYSVLPLYPHFRSGPVEGSACDTLGLNSLSPSMDWLDFGSVPPGGDSLRGFWARSHVGYPATVRQLDLPAGSAFAAGPLAPLYAIPKYDSVWVPVRFAPLQTGAFDDTLYLRTNYGHLAVRLTGTSDTITSNLPAAPRFSGLRVFPNPTNGAARVVFSAASATETLLSVYDALGRVALRRPVVVLARENTFELPLLGAEAGVYCVEVQGVGRVLLVKN